LGLFDAVPPQNTFGFTRVVPTGAVIRLSSSRLADGRSLALELQIAIGDDPEFPGAVHDGDTGTLKRAINRCAWRSGRSGPRVIWIQIVPDSQATWSTSAVWRSIDMFL
jgi:hypothetical protein